MTPYSLTAVVNHSSSCQDISNHNPGTTSAALKKNMPKEYSKISSSLLNLNKLE
jgi:hypothetical protein